MAACRMILVSRIKVAETPFYVCGRPCEPGKNYCAAHKAHRGRGDRMWELLGPDWQERQKALAAKDPPRPVRRGHPQFKLDPNVARSLAALEPIQKPPKSTTPKSSTPKSTTPKSSTPESPASGGLDDLIKLQRRALATAFPFLAAAEEEK